MSRASTPTILALDRYAAILGLNPAHFNTATAGDIFPSASQCNDLWWQYAWQQNDRVSREELADAIATAEDEIAQVIGYFPGPKWIEDEPHNYPRPHRPDRFGTGRGVRYLRKSIKLDWGKFIEAGQRAVTLIDNATVAGGELVYSDEDGDGFNETATITVATALTDACEIKAYFQGESTPEWEIRPARSKTITGGNAVLVFWSWQLIDPDLWEALPTADGVFPVDVTDASNLVTQVDVYREYTDNTVNSAEFFWEPDEIEDCLTAVSEGLITGAHYEQNGVLYVRDIQQGTAVPAPATYDADEEVWTVDAWDYCREPDIVKAHYYCGELDNLFLSGRRCDPLSQKWAKAIAWLATCRLDKPFCSCAGVDAAVARIRTDLAESPGQGISRFVTEIVQKSQFGTMRGEVFAWNQCTKLAKRRGKVAVI